MFKRNMVTVEHARATYTAKRQKCKLSYDELWDMFEQDVPLRVIGEKAGVSYYMVSLLYRDYFAKWMNPEWDTARARRVGLTKLREEAGVQLAIKQLRVYKLIEPIIDEYKLEVQGVRSKNTAGASIPRERLLLINNKLVHFHLCDKAHIAASEQRPYYRMYVTGSGLENSDFTVLIANDEEHTQRIYVFPNELLIAHLRGLNNKRNRKLFYPPVYQLAPYRNMKPAIDYWEYLDAWHLITKE